MMAQHADTIAEERAASVGTGGIHRENADGFIFAAQFMNQTIRESALPSAGRPGEPDHGGASGMRKQFLQQRFGCGGSVFDGRGGPGERACIAREYFGS
jgi:hypothetical protein